MLGDTCCAFRIGLLYGGLQWIGREYRTTFLGFGQRGCGLWIALAQASRQRRVGLGCRE
jgi:hypothetical protein